MGMILDAAYRDGRESVLARNSTNECPEAWLHVFAD
jgi:hypothetical protein